TPLLITSDKGHKAIIKILVEHGADINKENKRGETALSLAFNKGYKDIITYLIKHG
ncbi:hypothetical protein PIROE2DRAFT_30628, partial [Piromyces sp. E2]